ncbi:MAG: hypothetical protein HY689_11885 [Chloroflexi bacterium]|nr:hypothetical protein [Chloroflexota bacterium]
MRPGALLPDPGTGAGAVTGATAADAGQVHRDLVREMLDRGARRSALDERWEVR